MIKFRGKRIDNKEWIEGDFINADAYGDTSFKGEYEIRTYGIYGDAFGIIQKSISMSTGIKDKNGVEIFGSIPLDDGTISQGGDIVSYTQEMDVYSIIEPEIHKVIFNDGCFKPCGYDSNDCFYSRELPECRIIGKAYDEEGIK